MERLRFEDYFSSGKLMLLDGATGTELLKIKTVPERCFESWNAKHAHILKYLARKYFDVGSDAVLTNTFGATRFHLERHGLEKSVYELNKIGARNALCVCQYGKFVIGNIGPTGKTVDFDLTRQEATEAYAEQVRGLRDGRVHAFSLETFADLNEMKCAIAAIRDNSDLPYLGSMVFTRLTKDGYKTEHGVTIPKAVETLTKLGAFAIGSNCGNGIEAMIKIAEEIRKSSSDAKIIIQPNAGKPKLVDGIDVYPETPEFFVKHLPNLLQYNLSILGGCCGTTPEHIKAMRKFLDKK